MGRYERKEKPAACPFCDERVPRPKEFPEDSQVTGGRCSCGAIFITDTTGKDGGQAFLDGLTLLCGGDVDRAMELSSEDYELKKIGYRPRTHSLEPRMPKRGSFGRPKLWFVRLPES
jgi:hypothetical protein